MTSLSEILKSNRPHLSNGSIKTYVSSLRTFYKKIYPEDTEPDYAKLEDKDKVMRALEDVHFNKRKSILAALVVLLPTSKTEEYHSQMMNDIKEHNTEQMQNKKTPTQEANWITQPQIKEIFDMYSNSATQLMKRKDTLSMANLQTIQNFIILCLCSGIFIPPRRSLDWCAMKYKAYTDEDNIFNKKEFIFNKYKTARFYHQQNFQCPPELKKILVKWVKLIPEGCPYLLFDTNGNSLTAVKLDPEIKQNLWWTKGISEYASSFILE